MHAVNFSMRTDMRNSIKRQSATRLLTEWLIVVCKYF